MTTGELEVRSQVTTSDAVASPAPIARPRPTARAALVAQACDTVGPVT